MCSGTVPIKGWIMNPDVHGIFDGPGSTVCLPTHYGKIVHTDVVTQGATMVIYGGGGPEIYLEHFPRSSFQLPSVFLFTDESGNT